MAVCLYKQARQILNISSTSLLDLPSRQANISSADALGVGAWGMNAKIFLQKSALRAQAQTGACLESFRRQASYFAKYTYTAS